MRDMLRAGQAQRRMTVIFKSDLREIIRATLRDFLEDTDCEDDILDIEEVLLGRMEDRFHVTDDESEEYDED